MTSDSFDDGAVALLGGLGRSAEQLPDPRPGDAGHPAAADGVENLPLTARPRHSSTLQQVLLNDEFVALGGLVAANRCASWSA